MSIKVVSYSMLQDYRECPLRVKFKHIERIREPDSDAASRGINAHKAFERAVQGLEQFEFKALQPLIDAVPKEFAFTEHVLKFDERWSPIYPGVDLAHAFIAVIDLHVVTPDVNVTIDLKTGKRFGNEYKHFNQIKTYSMAAMLYDPNKYSTYNAELWYADQNDVVSFEFTRVELQKYWAKLDAEIDKLRNDTHFNARPSKPICKWCAYGPNKLNICPVGVK